MQVSLGHSGSAAKPAAAQDTSTWPVKYVFVQFHRMSIKINTQRSFSFAGFHAKSLSHLTEPELFCSFPLRK